MKEYPNRVLVLQRFEEREAGGRKTKEERWKDKTIKIWADDRKTELRKERVWDDVEGEGREREKNRQGRRDK